MELRIVKFCPPCSIDRLRDIFEIRRIVFVEEQKVESYDEFDEFELTSTHYLCLLENMPVATARKREINGKIKLERFAVLPQYRRKGIALRLLNHILEEIKNFEGEVYLHAQLHAVPLYEKGGFIKTGPLFFECNIPHFKMVLSSRHHDQ